MKRITSIKDPIVEEARNLQSINYRKQSNNMLLYGIEQLKWAIDSKIEIKHVFVEQGNANIVSHLNCQEKIIEVSSGILKKISGTNYVVPCMAVASLQQATKIQDDFIIVMDNLQDFGNIGSIIRTAKGFSVEQFILSSMQADPFQRKVIDAARGHVFNSTIMQTASAGDTIKYLKSNDYQIIVTSPHAKNLQSQVPLSSKKIALVIGNETTGASNLFLQSADLTIQIPMSTQVESLNASVSAGISIYELKFRQVLMMLKEKIFADFGRQVNVTGKLIRMAFDKEIKQCTNLSGMQVILMMIMHCDGKMSTKQISHDIALSANDFDQFMKPLISKNYVELCQDEYCLSSGGIRFLAEIWPIVQQTHQKIMSLMTTEEGQQLKVLLGKVQKGCMQILEITEK